MAGDCVEYQGARNDAGYGILPREANGSRLAHRAVLAEKLGRPVDGVARHTCDNPPCVNPAHLMEGTQAANVMDAVERGRVRGGRYNQTHCINGHELSPDNVQVYLRESTHKTIEARRCMACRREANKRQSEARKQARHERGLIRKRKVS